MMIPKAKIMATTLHLDDERVELGEEYVAVESPVHLFLGGIHFVSILCTPLFTRELIVGHLLSEGIISSVQDIASVDSDERDVWRVNLLRADPDQVVVTARPYTRLIVSACGSTNYRSLSDALDTIEFKSPSDWKIKASIISASVRKLNDLASIFRETGGVHVAACWLQNGELVRAAEDVGRHNAVDKVIGGAALSNQRLDECFLTLSGRMTGDIILKAARVGVPIVASRAAAVDSGILVAEKAGITLAGFVRGKRLKIYTFAERIVL